jgi:hypothetical protein
VGDVFGRRRSRSSWGRYCGRRQSRCKSNLG